MKSLRRQLMFSHLALVALMALVMTGAILNFFHLGRSIDRILRDNYKSVIAAQDMKETLERQDSAVTFFLAGQTETARAQYQANWPLFEKAYNVESHNITEAGEQAVAKDIERRYGAYRTAVEKLLYATPPWPTPQARAYYFGTLEPSFVRLKQRAQDVLDLNQAAIVRGDARAKGEARRASWLGIAMTIGALLLAVAFARGAINAALTPLLALAQAAEEVGAGHLNRRIELKRSDEIGTLAQAFNQMAEKLREMRRVEQQRLHRAERMSDAALENLYDPVLVTDAGGNVVHLNRAAEGLFGAAGQAAGLPVAQVVREDRIVAAIQRALRQELVSAEEGEPAYVALHTGNTQRIYRLRVTPMTDSPELDETGRGTLLGAALVLEDVTDLRELDRLKSEFIGVASHELRTPVTSLLLAAQLLQEGSLGPLTDVQRDVVTAQCEDLERLERLMRDLLDITRLEAGMTLPRFELVQPLELVEAAVTTVAAQAATKGVRLDKSAPLELPAVNVDSVQLTRVLVNLLDNAIRHTPEGGIVRVQAISCRNQVRFSVEDNGVGIPPEYLAHIFDRFVQVPGATRGGAGLGLSIARTIMQAHGSDMTAHSEPGKGSRFSFALPAATDRAASATPAQGSDSK